MVLVKPRKTPPKTTTRSHPLLVARGFFTVEEDKWIWEHMEEFSHVQGRGRVDSPNGQHRVTVAAAHHARLKAAFESVFPYRNPHPEHGTMVEKDKAGLMCSVWDWENIGGRIYNFLRRRLNSMERRKRSEALWGSEYPPYLDEARDLGSDYQMDGESAEEVVRAMGEIGRESCYSWAEVNDSEITRRQTNLPIDMQTMANLLSRSTGAEIYTVAVWQRDGQVMCCDTSTRRISSFSDTPSAHNTRQAFQDFVFRRIGASLETNLTHAGRAVVGDPDADNRPVLPEVQTDDEDPDLIRELGWIECKLRYQWNWQGGHSAPPWALLHADGVSNSYAMIEKQRLPESIAALRDPVMWDLAERRAWSKHLRRGDSGELPHETVFQFLQTSPGVFDFDFRHERPDGAILTYQPESIAFALRQDRIRKGASYGTRADDLPCFRPADTYKPMSDDQLEQFEGLLPGRTVVKLLGLLNGFESFGPHQATDEFWERIAVTLPHVKSELPAEDSMFEHFQRHGWCVREEFFNHRDPEHSKWSLPACIAWCHPTRWFHTPSNTFEGGPYGVKWPILLLAFLLACASSLAEGNVPELPGNTAASFTERDVEQLEDITVMWLNEMQQSTDRLESTYAERVLRLQGIPELSIGQNVNSVGLIGPDQEASEWEANDVNPDEYDMETARNVAPQTPRPNRKRRASGSGSQRKRARTESIERQDVDELEEELSPPATSKAKGGKKPARATRKNVPKVVLPGPKGKKVPASKTPAKKAAPKKAATKKGKTSVQVLSDDDEDTAGEDQLEEDEASGTWTDEATASTIKHNTRSRAKRAK